MQLVLGHLGHIISSRVGVQFILTGIVLSQFYLRLPPSNNMVSFLSASLELNAPRSCAKVQLMFHLVQIGMTTRALITMSNPEVWQGALRLYGPAPRAVTRFARLRNHTVAMVN